MTTPTPPHSDAPPVGVPLTDGWIEWHGGDNPVPGQMVEIQWGDSHPVTSSASESCDWHSRHGPFITAYRPVPEAVSRPVPAPSAAPAEPAGGGDWEAADLLTMLDDYAGRYIGATSEEDMSLEEMLISKSRAVLAALQAAPVAGVGEAVAWQARMKGSDHWYALDFRFVEGRMRDPQVEVRPLYAAPSPDAGIVAKLVGALVQELAPDQGETCHPAFNLAVQLQQALAARQPQ